MSVPIMTIDARMMCDSGIGTYVSNLLPRIVQSTDWRFFLLGKADDLQALEWTKNDRVEIVNVSADIYSVAQQLEIIRATPNGSRLFWSPHYDIPLFVRSPLLVTVHDLAHLALPKIFSGIKKQLYARTMMSAVRCRADRILFVSKFTESEFGRLVGPPNCPSDVIYLAADERWHRTNGHFLSSPHPKPYVICVGNVKPHKNISALIRAFAMLPAVIPHDLVIVGKKDGFLTNDPTLDDSVRGNGRIVFTGRISDSELKRYVAKASLLVQPSLYEGFGLTPIEAMACGCPVAASNFASLPEVCGDGAAYFNPENAQEITDTIIHALSDEPYRRALVERGHARAQKFSWHRSAAAIKEIAAELMQIDAPPVDLPIPRQMV